MIGGWDDHHIRRQHNPPRAPRGKCRDGKTGAKGSAVATAQEGHVVVHTHTHMTRKHTHTHAREMEDSESRHTPCSARAHDAAVRATNDDAFASKTAAMCRGHFSDTRLASFARIAYGAKLPTRAPVINHGTCARVRIMRGVMEECMKWAEVIVSIGAGFDTGLLRDGYGGMIVEVDFGDVVDEKMRVGRDVYAGFLEDAEVMERGLRGRIKGGGVYVLIGCDLRGGVEDCLKTAGVDFGKATAVFAEIVLVYMKPAHADAVIAEMARIFGECVFVVLEHTQTNAAFTREMKRNIAARGSPLLGLERYPGMRDAKERFLRLGWPVVCAETMADVEKGLRNVCEGGEVLDEVEQLELIMRHYVVLVAGSHTCEGRVRDIQALWRRK